MLAAINIFQLYESFLKAVGPAGLVLTMFVGIAALYLCFSRKGARILFFVFLIISLFTTIDPEAGSILTVLFFIRYALLFPVAFWGLLSLFSRDKKVGFVGWLLLLHVLFFVFSFLSNDLHSFQRLFAMFLLWLAIVGNISSDVSDVEHLKTFLSRFGFFAWIAVIIIALYAAAFPYRSFLAGRFTSIFYRSNALGIAMFFLLIPLGYRAFYLIENKFRVVDMILSLMAALFMIMSGTRSAVFASVPLFLVLIKGKSKAYILIGILAASIVVTVIVLNPNTMSLVQERFLGVKEMTTSGRYEIWLSHMNVVLEKPFFGYGLGYSTDEADSLGASFNSYLSVAIEGGIVNVIILILVSAASLFNCIHAFIRGVDRKIALFLIAAVSGVIFISFFESIASGIGGGGIVVVWTIFQLSAGLRKRDDLLLEFYSEEYEAEYPVEFI